MRIRRVRFVLLATLLLAPVQATAQNLLVIPDISLASLHYLEARKEAAATFRRNNPTATQEQVDSAVFAAVQPEPYWDKGIGEMGPELSEQFWGEAGSRVLPGSSLGFSSDKAALYTELGAVVTGSWRFAVGTTLSVSTTDTADSTVVDTNTGLNRFIAGGGGLSLQVLRPASLAQLNELTRVGLFFVPRVWTNLPSLTSTDGLRDYGGEVAASLIFQRHDNQNRPFLTLETRAGIVAGSSEFYDTIGSEDAERFLYLAPTLTMRIIDQVNIGVSTFISESFDSPGLRLNLSLLNKDKDPPED